MNTSHARFRGPAALLVGLAVGVSLASCGAALPDPSTAVSGRATAARTIAPGLCQASALAARGGREGENTGAHGDIEITNKGSSPCTLWGVPELAVIQADGSRLAVRQVAAASLSVAPVVLRPHGRGVALLAIYWSNWCARTPGALRLRLALPGSGGTLLAPFDGPPDYNLVPACLSRAQDSTIAVVDAYSQGSL
jgi:hypothetical protein